jgi:hypothetical protein
MFNHWIDGARTLLTSNPGVAAAVVFGGSVAVAFGGALATCIVRSLVGRGRAWSRLLGQEGNTAESPQTPTAAGATSGAARMLPAAAAPARRKRPKVIAAIVGIGVIAAAGWAIGSGGVELARRYSPKDPEKAAFDACFEEARVRPGFELAKKPGVYPHYNDIRLTVRESRNDYLVTSVYGGFFGIYSEPYNTGFVLETHTITIQDRNMQPFGRTETYKMRWIKYRVLAGVDLDRKGADGDTDFQPLIDGLSTGTITIDDHDDRIDNHLRAIRQFQDKKNRYEAEYAKRTQRGLE